MHQATPRCGLRPVVKAVLALAITPDALALRGLRLA